MRFVRKSLLGGLCSYGKRIPRPAMLALSPPLQGFLPAGGTNIDFSFGHGEKRVLERRLKNAPVKTE